MTRSETLDRAKQCVCEDRASTYGPPEDNFARIAALASVAIGVPLTATDVAVFLVCVKLARLRTSPAHGDNWIDLAGYAACGAEIATSGK